MHDSTFPHDEHEIPADVLRQPLADPRRALHQPDDRHHRQHRAQRGPPHAGPSTSTPSTTDLQWMVDAYALVFAGMLFTAGTLGDRFGRKGALQAGLVALPGRHRHGRHRRLVGRRSSPPGPSWASAPRSSCPRRCRSSPTSSPPHERPKAIAIWAGISGGGAAIGPIASGFLLEHFWWGSVFLVNVPGDPRRPRRRRTSCVPTSRDPEQPPLDIPGAAAVDRRPRRRSSTASSRARTTAGPARTTLGTFAVAAVALGALRLAGARRPSTRCSTCASSTTAASASPRAA